MSYRVFVDPDGHKWQVWMVSTSAVERRRRDRRIGALGAPGIERRIVADRRRHATRARMSVAAGFEQGWLCFESDRGEKRRLIPIPAEWDQLDDSQLTDLSRRARQVRQPQAALP
ncbi:MAG TPA: hypothetical protein VF042_02320 [Gemmatimonadaceae bacterium]